jgi:uncharacterized membrane protein YhaH (DUF805 family)
MVNLTNIGTLFAFMLVCIGIIILRIKDPHRERGFRVPGGPWFFPVLGAVSCVFLATYLPADSWWRFGLWLATGIIVYATYGLRAIVYPGRMSRLRYLTGILVILACEWILWMGVRYLAHIGDMFAARYSAVVIVAAAISVFGILTVRRLHDIDRDGRAFWWMFVPVYNIYFLLMLLLKPGTEGPNRFDRPAPPPAPAVGGPILRDFNPESQLPESDVHGH